MAKTRIVIVGLSAAVSLLVASDTANAQAWNGGSPPRNGACFYRDANYRGPHFCLESNQEQSSLSHDVNDHISSIRVYGNVEVRAYEDSRFRGESLRFRSDVRDLDRENWNDLISSIEVRRNGGGTSGNQGNVDRIIRGAYQDILKRDPDPEGMRTYRSRMIDDGWSEQDVREALRKSPEYREQNTMTRAKAEAIVRDAYLAVLKREPDPASSAYVDAVYRRKMTREQLERSLRNSPEYRNR